MIKGIPLTKFQWCHLEERQGQVDFYSRQPTAELEMASVKLPTEVYAILPLWKR